VAISDSIAKAATVSGLAVSKTTASATRCVSLSVGLHLIMHRTNGLYRTTNPKVK